MKNYKFFYRQNLIFETDAENNDEAIQNARHVLDNIAPPSNPYLNTCGITIKVTTLDSEDSDNAY